MEDAASTSTSNTHLWFPNDILPPEGNFNSQKAVFDHINSWVNSWGYAFLQLANTLKSFNDWVKIFFIYDRDKRPLVYQQTEMEDNKPTYELSILTFLVVAKESLNRIIRVLRHQPD